MRNETQQNAQKHRLFVKYSSSESGGFYSLPVVGLYTEATTQGSLTQAARAMARQLRQRIAR